MATFAIDEIMGGRQGVDPGFGKTNNPNATRVPGGVKKRKKQPQVGGSDMSDLAAVFGSMPIPHGVKRPMVRRGMSGAELRPDGSDPGNSFDAFVGKNPQYSRENRQATIDEENQRRYDNINQQGAAAVDFAKRTGGFTNAQGQFIPPTTSGGLPGFKQEFTPSGLPKEDVVGSSDGYKTVFDPSGRAVGTNRPLGTPEDAGLFGVGSTNPMNANLGGQIQGQFDQPPQSQHQYSDLFQPGGVQVKAAPSAPPAFSDIARRYMESKAKQGLPSAPSVPQGRSDYVFIDPSTGYPTSGTLGEKELAKRSARGLIPGIGDQAGQAVEGAGNLLDQFWKMLFGQNIETQRLYQPPLSSTLLQSYSLGNL